MLSYRDGCPSGLSVTAFPVPAGPPRFATRKQEAHTIGLLLRDEATGGTCAFVPGCGGLDDALLARLGQRRAGAVRRHLLERRRADPARDLAIARPGRWTISRSRAPVEASSGWHGCRRRTRVYTHINNTNPILVEDSPERAEVERHGLVVGADGMHFSL